MKNKPTYEEKLRALKETIKRWERIADKEDYEYYNNTNCPLCMLSDGNPSCWDGCPIREKTGRYMCCGTPFHAFNTNHTKENALAEVVFLKNLYIEMLEKEYPGAKHIPKEKKKEWVDVGKELYVKLGMIGDKYYPRIFHEDKEMAFMACDGWQLAYGSDENYKLEQDERGNFRIFKKV